MNKNVIDINKDSLTLRALLNIMPSYKIFISPTMATLKAETFSCFMFFVSNTMYAVFDGRLQVINNPCFLFIISCCSCIIHFNISFPSTLKASRSRLSAVRSKILCEFIIFLRVWQLPHLSSTVFWFPQQIFSARDKKGPSTGFSQQSLQFLRFPLTISISSTSSDRASW